MKIFQISLLNPYNFISLYKKLTLIHVELNLIFFNFIEFLKYRNNI